MLAKNAKNRACTGTVLVLCVIFSFSSCSACIKVETGQVKYNNALTLEELISKRTCSKKDINVFCWVLITPRLCKNVQVSLKASFCTN